ncbi:LOW QUALITY PROTEIN: coiled-coil domain-containing protein 122 [Boleophthalmus pectinirostris]|uniref:LOW QUALITY PROTEIN: coiled-coil domain-containing protein 122 n=1 Tax=Boleophthalmus pectinirostris TaxID=150288 RepID=UPI002431E5DB|nr:LOW QUALITY PROTEIN: coiled-coil domain-containing protein 122 [Boleophthalmus pectinirostris]
MSVENGSQDCEFTLSKVVEDVSQHSFAQTEALKDKQKVLQTLEASLSDAENQTKQVEIELRSKVRQILTLETDSEHLEQHTQDLLQRCTAISQENAELESLIREEQEKVSAALALYHSYRAKMEEHRVAVELAVSQTQAHKELEKRQAGVRMLKRKKEELREDLENPSGNAVQMAKRETSALKEQIIAKKKTLAEKRNKLRKEAEMHHDIKKDIEIQNRRYEAIVKRLHCQLSKAQSVHRQMSAEVNHMERQVSELKRQLETSQNSLDSAWVKRGTWLKLKDITKETGPSCDGRDVTNTR